jgi:hypothetical protein
LIVSRDDDRTPNRSPTKADVVLNLRDRPQLRMLVGVDHDDREGYSTQKGAVKLRDKRCRGDVEVGGMIEEQAS